jgi:hypothetical protein
LSLYLFAVAIVSTFSFWRSGAPGAICCALQGPISRSSAAKWTCRRPSPTVRETGAEADIKRAPELVPEGVAKKSGYKLDQAAPIATVAELPNYDAIIFGSGTRFGVVTSQMRNFLARQADFGQRARQSEKSDQFSRVLGRSMAVRNRPFSR